MTLQLTALAQRVARLNPHCAEMGAGMLASLVSDAHAALANAEHEQARLPYCIPAASWADKATGHYWLAYPRLGWRKGRYALINTSETNGARSFDAVVDDFGELVKAPS